MPNPTPTTLTPEIIAAHERLYPRLKSLLQQVELVAGKRPGQVVAEETMRLGRGLCVEAIKLLGREGRLLPIPQSVRAAPLDHAGFSVILGQALAALEGFEAAHCRLDRSGLLAWQLAGGELKPVARHLKSPPRGRTAPAEPEKPDYGWMGRTASEARDRLYRRILERENLSYARGYADAQAGKPPREPRTEIGLP